MKSTVIIPTLNEEENIGRLIEKLTKLYPEIKIIVSDDGSKDGTKKVVSEYANAFFLDRSKAKVKGLTASILDAVNEVKTDKLVVMDADFQHPAEKVGEICNKLDDFKVVVGTRVKIEGGWGITRKLMSWTAKILGNIRIGVGGDIMSGFFGVNTQYFQKVIKENRKRFELRGYKVLFDLLKIKRIKTGRVGYTFNIRTKGESKISHKHIVYYIRSFFK